MKPETAKKRAQKSRIENIAYMGVRYSAMTRVFRKGSKESIVHKVEAAYRRLEDVENEEEYRRVHRSFCRWFASNIRTAKGRRKASYGQAAKTLDVAMKVFVYYCGLPRGNSSKIVRWLNCAIDTKILRNLKRRFSDLSDIRAYFPRGIGNEETYTRLQAAVWKDIESKYSGAILPVEYDDMEHGQIYS